MESLISGSDYFGDSSSWRTSMLHVVAFRLAQDLACLK